MHIFGLDIDGTYSETPKLFHRFIDDANRMFDGINTKVIVTTMRFKNELIGLEELIKREVPIIFTGRLKKQDYLKELAIHVNVWIDDNPHFLTQDAFKEHIVMGRVMNEFHREKYNELRTQATDDVVLKLRQYDNF